MNKTLYIISLIVVLSLTSCQSSLMTNHTAASEIQLEINPAVKAMQRPVDTAVAITFPTTIQDPTLLEGWIRLYNSTQNCGTWDGYTLTGQKLAQYVVDQALVITWNTSTIYIGSWVDRDNTGTIYINPGYKEETETQMINLVSEISHEIFHDLTPFNQKADTLYEEYWAFYVGACVSGQSTEDFEHFNPISSASLTQWFETNNRGNYLGVFEMYPEDMVAISIP
jgi:hypothetical protein